MSPTRGLGRIESLDQIEDNIFRANIAKKDKPLSEKIKNTPSESVYQELQNLISAADTLSINEQRIQLNFIREQAKERLVEVAQAIRLLSNEYEANDPEDINDLFFEIEDGLSLIHEASFLTNLIYSMSSNDLSVIENIESLQLDYLGSLMSEGEDVVEDSTIDDLTVKVINLIKDAPGLTRKEQISQIDQLHYQILKIIDDNKKILNDLISKRDLQKAKKGAVEDSLNNLIVIKDAQLALLEKLSKITSYHDLGELTKILHDKAIPENEKITNSRNQNERERFAEAMKQNTAIQTLIDAGFDKNILLTNVESSHDWKALDPDEAERIRNKELEKKYRYIESAVISLLLKAINKDINPINLEISDLSSLSMRPSSESGSRVSFNISFKELIGQISTNMPTIEQARAGRTETSLNSWVTLLNQWATKNKELRNLKNREEFAKLFKSGEITFNREFIFDESPLSLATAPPFMVEVKNPDGSLSWEPVFLDYFYQKDSNGNFIVDPEGDPVINPVGMRHLFEDLQYILIANNRFGPGFLANTATLDLNEIFLKENGTSLPEEQRREVLRRIPSMWLTNDQLFRPSVFINPGHDQAKLDVVGDRDLVRTPTYPRSMYAKDATYNRSTQNLERLFTTHFSPPEVDSDTINTATHEAFRDLVEIFMECTLFPSLTDSGVVITEDSKILLEGIITRIAETQGKFISQKNNIWIAVKYLLGKEEIGRTGVFNNASLAVVGPKPFPDLYDSTFLSDVDDNGDLLIGTVKDFHYWKREKSSEIPWEQIPNLWSNEFANEFEYFLRVLAFIHETRDAITSLLELNQKEGFVEVVKDELVQSLINLERAISVYILGSCNIKNKTTNAFLHVLNRPKEGKNIPRDIEKVMDTLFNDSEKNALIQILTTEDFTSTDIDTEPVGRKKALLNKFKQALTNNGRADNTYLSNLEKRFEALHDDLNSRHDYACRVIVRNTDTGEVKFADTTAYQHFQLTPAVILNQDSNHQIENLRSPNDKVYDPSKQYAEWVGSWEDAVYQVTGGRKIEDLKDSDFERMNITREELLLWQSYAANPDKHPMPILFINVGGKRAFNPKNGEYEQGGKTTTPNPLDMIADKIFFDSIGAANSSGNVFERMTGPQKLAFAVAFSPQARWRFINKYYEFFGGATAIRIANKVIPPLAKFLEISVDDRITDLGKNELPESLALPAKGDMGLINRFLARMGTMTTVEEMLKNRQIVEGVMKMFSVDV